jgi:hypothetical protein
MKFYKLKTNEQEFNMSDIKFDDDLKITDESKNNITEYLNKYVEEFEYKTNDKLLTIISDSLKLSDKNIGNTIDIHTTDKNIFQMCYIEHSYNEDNSVNKLNFLATIMNNKRKQITGDAFIFSNSLLTTKIDEKDKAVEYINLNDMELIDLIDVILINYYRIGVCFDGDEYTKFIFDNNMVIIAPLKYNGINLSELGFKKSHLLNFGIDMFYTNEGENELKKYNSKLASFYWDIGKFKDKVFIALRSETEKKYDSLIDEYIDKILNIYEKYCFDDDEMNVPKEFKFYDYQTNEKYTNKYIVFDNLYDKIVLSYKK